MTDIETVTVSFEELKANLDRYMRLKETKRLVVIRNGEQLAVLGLRHPGEERGFLTHSSSNSWTPSSRKRST